MPHVDEKYLYTTVSAFFFSAFDHSIMAGDAACDSVQMLMHMHRVPFQWHLYKTLCGMGGYDARGLGDLCPCSCRMDGIH